MAAADGSMVDVPDVVDNALRHIASKQGFKKPQFNVTSGSRNRDGFMSTLYRCVIRDEDSARPAELKIMVKISREGMETMMSNLFGVEGLVYETLIPAQEKLAGLREPLPWPKCYFSAVKGSHPYCLALEDFGPEGFVNADRSKGLDAAHMRLALEQLGKFHGASMALVRLRPELFKTIEDQVPNLPSSANAPSSHIKRALLRALNAHI
ncbi:uncharacterized protein LOC127749953 [Frankliniella occidentalis]|uniref:Uncharacterized protein LOC127749953 n=2 Tax=Frankliniella occidentalis TaxID=133901 RepID=A0A9C6UEP2_FRAOC|nr:uncharacterized protein LOC127749953 [Frankliniella occidentalis]